MNFLKKIVLAHVALLLPVYVMANPPTANAKGAAAKPKYSCLYRCHIGQKTRPWNGGKLLYFSTDKGFSKLFKLEIKVPENFDISSQQKMEEKINRFVTEDCIENVRDNSSNIKTDQKFRNDNIVYALPYEELGGNCFDYDSNTGKRVEAVTSSESIYSYFCASKKVMIIEPTGTDLRYVHDDLPQQMSIGKYCVQEIIMQVEKNNAQK